MKKKQQQYFTAGNSSAIVTANASQITLPSGSANATGVPTNIVVNNGGPLGTALLA